MKSIAICVVLSVLMVSGVLLTRTPGQATTKQIPTQSAGSMSVGALGRIEPQSEVIQVNAPSALEPALVQELLVEEGDTVATGQTLAILDSHRREQADVEMARASLLLAEKELAQVLAGARVGDIQAQEALVERTRTQVALSEKQLQRARRLTQSNAMTVDELDVHETGFETLQRELRQHEATLAAVKEVRPVDVAHAEAKIRQATAMLQRAEADFEISVIKSPLDGTILRIHTRQGERISTSGLLEMGNTSQMDVVAEVHEADILKVKPGQLATVELRNLEQTLRGQVIRVGRLIGRKDVLSSDPVDDTDARVIEVRIRLDEAGGQLVAGMSYARVEVRIETTAESVP